MKWIEILFRVALAMTWIGLFGVFFAIPFDSYMLYCVSGAVLSIGLMILLYTNARKD